MYIKRVSIKNFRTLLDFEIELDEKFQIIAGANNSGKSNLLRALNIFFNEGFDEDSCFDKTKDLSYHIEKGTGSSSPTTIEVDLFLKDDEIRRIKNLDEYIIENNIIRTRGYYFGELEGWHHSNQDGT
ncbi:AAA family ATPase, partial [Sulfurospirillum sp. T05]